MSSSSRLAWIGSWAASLGLLACSVALAQEQERAPRARPVQLETYGDPPAKAGAASTGRRSPAARIVRGQFVTVQVNVDALGLNILGDAANEPSIAVDPLAPQRMAIGWRQFDTIASNFRQAGYAYTSDGGATWAFPGRLTPGVFRSDPVLASDSSGAFYYYSLGTPGGQFLCDVFKSLDGGKTWSGPTPAFGGDKAWISVHRTGGLGDGNVYAEWSVYAGCCGNDVFTRSTNGGQAWSSPSGMPQTPIWGTLAVAQNGTLFVAGADPNDWSNFLVARSTTAKDPGQSPTFSSVTSVDLGGALGLSTGPNPGGLLGQVWIETDPADPGRVYLLASVDPPGFDPMDVHFSRSLDGGLTWSAPVRVNDDLPGANAWQWFGTMSVAPNGRIDVVWNDTATSNVANVSELFYASSTDGGSTWSSGKPASPAWNSHVGWPNQDKIGDYYHMVSENHVAHLAWAATFNGEQDVYFTRIRP